MEKTISRALALPTASALLLTGCGCGGGGSPGDSKRKYESVGGAVHYTSAMDK